jgi:DNA-binding MarR family transcriptional regulator
MSPNGKTAPAPAGGWLEGDQQRAWLAYIRVQLRLAYEMNRQLLADSGMSLPDYDVLTGLSVAEGGRMPITVLAAQIGWERSRVSHHVRRMSARGLVTCGLSAADRRVTEVTLTARGRQAQEEAAPGHVDLVRRLFFGGLPEGLVGPLGEALEGVYAHIIKRGSLPPPVDWHPEEDCRAAPCRLGPASAGNRRAWDRHGTRQLLIRALPGRARSPAALQGSRLRPVGNEVLVIRVGAYARRRRLSIRSYAPSRPSDGGYHSGLGALTHGVLIVIAAKRRRGGRRRPPGLDRCRVPPRHRQARRGRHPRAAAGHRDRRSRLPRPCRAPGSRNPAAQPLRQDRRCCRRIWRKHGPC